MLYALGKGGALWFRHHPTSLHQAITDRSVLYPLSSSPSPCIPHTFLPPSPSFLSLFLSLIKQTNKQINARILMHASRSVCLFLAGRLGLEGPNREPPAAFDEGKFVHQHHSWVPRVLCLCLSVSVTRVSKSLNQSVNPHSSTTSWPMSFPPPPPPSCMHACICGSRGRTPSLTHTHLPSPPPTPLLCHSLSIRRHLPLRHARHGRAGPRVGPPGVRRPRTALRPAVAPPPGWYVSR